LFVLFILSTGLKAQTGGPGQPEFMHFKPATATDLVNPSNGSFSYNIPLFDLGGYPVNLSYQSGVEMEQVASFVGLGWNINIGAVTHTMRGLPDDFRGDPVTRTIYMMDNVTYGGNVGVGVEIAGLPIGIGLNAGLGLFYNNYNGYGAEESFGMSFSMHNKSNTASGAISLGMKANSESGVEIYAKPTVSMHLSSSTDLSANGSLGGLISVNSREGLKGSINASMNVSENVSYTGTGMVRNSETNKWEKGPKEKEMSEQVASASAAYSFSKTPEIPRVSYPFVTESYTGSFKAGGELWFLYPNATLMGYYTKQALSTHKIITPAYGFLYADQAPAGSDNVLHDFNREKDQPYLKDASINIGIPYYTPDIYSVNAQGIAGSFQLNRDDIGVIFDNHVSSGGSALNIGVELGFGNAFHAGADISITNTSSSSGKWNSGITGNIAFKSSQPNNLYQSAYFKNASDVSVDENSFFDKLLGDKPIKVKIGDTQWWETNVDAESNFIDDNSNVKPVVPPDYFKDKRDPRTINIQYKTAAMASQFGLNKTIDEYRINDFGCDNIVKKHDRVNTFRKEHHISEITATNTDGMRYVFGLPTYDTLQKEVSFTLDKSQLPENDGLVTYDPNANWGKNGRDGFYESTELPPYVTSHLLTAVLSPDYVDVDNNGPSLNDAGNYVKINYSYAGIYRWRTPYSTNKATFNKALLSDDMDNKGSYVYGEKELWYTHSVESKTQIAEFYYNVNGRMDGLGVASEKGGKDMTQKLYKLDSIKVYSINERVLKGNGAEPIRIIYFTYDYELCRKINNTTETGATNNGKLTLKKVSFTSGKSRKELLSPYEFSYGIIPSGVVQNPDYNPRNVNRWGYYQLNSGTSDININTPLSNIDFPYSLQDEQLMTDYSYAWNLTKIKLPSNGTIQVQYEPHRYAYTQDKRCMQMFQMEATRTTPLDLEDTGGTIGITLKDPLSDPDPNAQLLYRYFNNDFSQWYYYKALVKLTDQYKEWISGYCKIASASLIDADHAAINLESVTRDDDNNGPPVNPIRKNAWQFMRMNRPEICYGPPEPNYGGGLEGFMKMSGLQQKVSNQITAFSQGFNSYAQSSPNKFASMLDPSKSFIRLYSPYKNKIIGGSRVRKIITDDNWKQETGNASDSKTYTIDYDYTNIEKNPITGLIDTISSGVMEYEPFNGQDENPMRQPVYIDQHIKMAPDNHLYIETPFNESLFPASNLTYAKVRVTSNKTDLHVPGQGYQEMEYYTAKEYPVSSDITDLGSNHEKKTNFLAAFAMSILGISEFHDYVTLSQGATITLNDMHGKQKATRNYNSNGALISSEQFEYSLGKTLNLINHSDTVYQSDKLGISASAICDSRTTEHSTEIDGVNLNFDLTFVGPFPLPLFVPMPNMSVENSRLNTVALNKIIYKKGILTKKTVTENGATVSTENILFDDKTGFMVLSKTTNEFNDTLYKFHYPADWIYSGLSAGYTSSDLEFTISSPQSNNYVVSPKVFAVLAIGDEIVFPYSNTPRYWITDKILPNNNSLDYRIELESDMLGGIAVSLGTAGNCRVLRPGGRNQLMQEAGSVVTRVNPIKANRIDFSEFDSKAQVINASMQEFADARIRYCNCYSGGKMSNPYLSGEKGNWYPTTTWSFLSDRVRSANVAVDQTNIRVDGAFSTYRNFWRYVNDANPRWQRFTPGWQWVETITKKDVNGLTLETSDVLGRHNALLTGYKNKLVVAEAGNARINEILFEGFEDWNYVPIAAYCDTVQPCVPRIVDWGGVFQQDASESHTGKYSGRLVESGGLITIPVTPVVLTREVNETDSLGNLLEPPPASDSLPPPLCAGIFKPTVNRKYVFSAWVRDDIDPLAINFAGPAVQIGSSIFHTSGNIIDGWQRIYGEFTIPPEVTFITLKFLPGAGSTWFDDIRIFPYDAKMITYVYDGNTQKLTFTSDENNYFTKYNYDASDNLESINKETAKGVQTIKEARSATVKHP
jgi:hypothetical protein